MNSLKIILSAILLISTQVFAADSMDKPAIAASHSVTLEATVQAIDHETRVVTIKAEGSEPVTFTASNEARNLGNVDVGDIVFAEYYEEVTISVHSPENIPVSASVISEMARTEEGELPGAVSVDTVVIISEVTEINLENNTFKLLGPEGNISEFVARDPENLRRSEVGDMVVITITQAIGVVVERPAE